MCNINLFLLCSIVSPFISKSGFHILFLSVFLYGFPPPIYHHPHTFSAFPPLPNRFQVWCFYCLGLLLSGRGYEAGPERNASTSVEVYDLLSGKSCSLPALPHDRYGHSISWSWNHIQICGGGPASMTTRLSCMVFSSGEWQQSHSLKHWRYSHCSWGVEGGVVLLGGYDSRDTSEVVTTQQLGLNHVCVILSHRRDTITSVWY